MIQSDFKLYNGKCWLTHMIRFLMRNCDGRCLTTCYAKYQAVL